MRIDQMSWGKDHPGPWGRPGTPPPAGKPEPPEPELDAMFRQWQELLQRLLGGGDGGRGFALLFGIALLLWAASGIYFVKPDEEGVVLRFGAFHRTTPPGIGYHLPWPVESVVTPRVTAINRVEIGYRSGGYRSGTESDLPEESLMLTGDENIVDIHFEVQWKIAKAEAYLFNVRNPDDTVKAVAESSMREVIGKTQIATVLAEGKLQVAQATKKLIQDTLNSYNAGIDIVSINLRDVNPPAQVIDAFLDVQTARTDMETARNQAQSYQNDIIPRARGEAQKMILDAQAYSQEVVARAGGDASRFASVYSAYKQARDVTRKRMYLETMETILDGMHKVVMDTHGTGAVPYLPLPALAPAAGGEEKK